jgi:NAD(P)-dependent dehydrogenase (short-subunit alcohol dehydrogenase family)
MSTVLVTGVNRGIGLEFVRQYASDGAKVIACAREPDKAKELKEFANKHQQIEIHPLDTSDFEACAA